MSEEANSDTSNSTKPPLKVAFPRKLFKNYKNEHEQENTLQSEAESNIIETSSITEEHQYSSNKKHKDKKNQKKLKRELKLLNKRGGDKQAVKAVENSSSLNNVEQISLNETNLSNNHLTDHTVFDHNNIVEHFHNMTNLQKTLTCLNELTDVEKKQVVNLITFSTNLNDKRGQTKSTTTQTDQNFKIPSEKQTNQSNNNDHETNRESVSRRSNNENRSVSSSEMESSNAELNSNTMTIVDSTSGERFIDENRRKDLSPLLLPTIAKMCNILNKYNFGFDVTDDMNTFLHQLDQLLHNLQVFCQLASGKQREQQQFYGLMQSNNRYINTQTQGDGMTLRPEAGATNVELLVPQNLTPYQNTSIISPQTQTTRQAQETTVPLVQIPVISETPSCQCRQAGQIQPAPQPVQETAPATQYGPALMPYQHVSTGSVQAESRRGHIKRRFSSYTDFPSNEISSHWQRQHPYHTVTVSQDTKRVRPQLVQNYHDANNDLVISQQLPLQTQQQYIATLGQRNNEHAPNN